MSVTTLSAFLDELATQLAARSGLAGVNVFTCPVRPEELGTEAIELAAETVIEQGRRAMNSTTQEESYEVTGSVLAYRSIPPASGGINTAAKAARDRAEAILEEVIDEVATNDTMTAKVRDVQLTGQTWRQGYAPEGQLGRFCSVEFTLTVGASVTP